MTSEEIKQRMREGVPLRWVSGEVAGTPDKNERRLFLGNRELDEDETYDVLEMEQCGELACTKDPHNRKHILRYSLQDKG